MKTRLGRVGSTTIARTWGAGGRPAPSVSQRASPPRHRYNPVRTSRPSPAPPPGWLRVRYTIRLPSPDPQAGGATILKDSVDLQYPAVAAAPKVLLGGIGRVDRVRAPARVGQRELCPAARERRGERRP